MYSFRHDNDRKLPRTTKEIYELNRIMARKMESVFLSKGVPVVPSIGALLHFLCFLAPFGVELMNENFVSVLLLGWYANSTPVAFCPDVISNSPFCNIFPLLVTCFSNAKCYIQPSSASVQHNRQTKLIFPM